MKNYSIHVIKGSDNKTIITRENKGFTPNEVMQIHSHALNEVIRSEAGEKMNVVKVNRIAGEVIPPTDLLEIHTPLKEVKPELEFLPPRGENKPMGYYEMKKLASDLKLDFKNNISKKKLVKILKDHNVQIFQEEE